MSNKQKDMRSYLSFLPHGCLCLSILVFSQDHNVLWLKWEPTAQFVSCLFVVHMVSCFPPYLSEAGSHSTAWIGLEFTMYLKVALIVPILFVLRVSLLSFYLGGPWVQTLVIRLGGKHLCLLSCVADP